MSAPKCGCGIVTYRVSTSTSTVQFAGEQIHRLLRVLAFQVSRTIKSPDPAAVHDLRVSIRRFTQALAAFKPCYSGKEVKRIRRRLGRIMTQAGGVRNGDIAIKLLSRSQAAQTAGLIEKVKGEREQAEKDLMDLLRRFVDRSWTSKWRKRLTSAAALQDAAGEEAIESTARRMLPRMARKFFSRGEDATHPDASPRDLHQFRIAAKHLRYTFELFAPLYGPTLSDRLEQIKAIQTVLGDVNDCETVRRMIARYPGYKKADAQLKRRERKKMDEFNRLWNATLGAAEKQRAWIEYLHRVRKKGEVARKVPGRASASAPSSSSAPPDLHAAPAEASA